MIIIIMMIIIMIIIIIIIIIIVVAVLVIVIKTGTLMESSDYSFAYYVSNYVQNKLDNLTK